MQVKEEEKIQRSRVERFFKGKKNSIRKSDKEVVK